MMWDPSVACDGLLLANSPAPTQSQKVVFRFERKGAFNHTTKLDDEGDHIASYEHLGQPSLLDQTKGFPIHASNDAAQNHVNTGCKECWSDEYQKGVNYIGTYCWIWRLSI